MNYTPKQKRVLEVIRDYTAREGMCPTLDEIADVMGTHRVTIHQHVGQLVKRGAVRKKAGMTRSIEILDPRYSPSPCANAQALVEQELERLFGANVEPTIQVLLATVMQRIGENGRQAVFESATSGIRGGGLLISASSDESDENLNLDILWWPNPLEETWHVWAYYHDRMGTPILVVYADHREGSRMSFSPDPA